MNHSSIETEEDCVLQERPPPGQMSHFQSSAFHICVVNTHLVASLHSLSCREEERFAQKDRLGPSVPVTHIQNFDKCSWEPAVSHSKNSGPSSQEDNFTPERHAELTSPPNKECLGNMDA